MSEFRSKAEYKQQRALQISGDVRSLVCFCVDISGSMDDSLSFWESRRRIDLLSGVLKNIIKGFRSDSKMNHAVAISIVTYRNYAQIKEPFQDAALYEDLESTCSFGDVDNTTNMTRGLNTSLRAIRDMQQDLMDKDQNSHPPLLVFMTDGEPTYDYHWESKFAEIRSMVASNHLHVFPIGISRDAKMSNLRGLFPAREVPLDFESKYCMQKEEDFIRVFDDIRRIIYEQIGGDDTRTAAACDDEDIMNNQVGQSAASFLLDLIQ